LNTNLLSLLAYVGAFCAGGLGLAVLIQAKLNAPRLTYVGGMIVAAATALFSGLSLGATSAAAFLKWQFLAQLGGVILPGIWLWFSLTFSRQSRDLRWATLTVAVVAIPAVLLVAGRNEFIGAIQPDGTIARSLLRLGWLGILTQIVVLTGCVLVLMNLERTFRAAVGTIRWRIKFMLLGVGVMATARIFTSSQALLFREIDPSLETVNSAALIVAVPLFLRSLFRSGHFETHVYPSRTVIQNSLAVLLAGIYLLILAAFAQFASYIGGDAAFALKAFLVLVAVVVLTILLQSDRLRLALRRFVSRHFQRPLHDYEAAWKKFTEATASRVEQSDLAHSIVTLIADMFQALSVSLWIVDDKETLNLTASTSVSKDAARDQQPRADESAHVMQFLRDNPRPIDFEEISQDWAEALRRWHTSEFANGGNRVALPLVCRGEVMGLITIGDRVSGIRFSLEDFDMLKCISDHAAASLLNVQLSQKQLQSKELEAFQTMATFFVHDLKNAASTLKLMLQNLPIHYNDPEFRADALRGIGKTVSHINHLTSRLGHLRHELKVQLIATDLNDLVTDATSELGAVSGATLTKDLRAAAGVMADRDQLQKVVTNLVLNAREASPDTGEVRVSTSQENGWVVLTVADEGCGMSPEFLSKSLFRPFQTTKKNGLGIGMFQSKMIIEAHGGKITVVSEPGKGTTFHVFLRAAAATSS